MVIKNDNYYLERIIVYINYILEYMEHIKNSNLYLRPNDQASDGVIYKFIQLKEEMSKLSDSFLDNHLYIKNTVRLLSGFRNRLTHDYENVSYSFFNEIILSDLPKLKSEIESIISVVS